MRRNVLVSPSKSILKKPILTAPLTLIFLIALAFPFDARACDLCGVYNSVLSSRGNQGSVNVGLAFQHTRLSSGIDLGKDIGIISEDSSQYMESFVSQVFGNYYFTDNLSFQVNIPIIDRNYRRLGNERGGYEYGSVSGVGDIPMLIKYQDLTFITDNRSLVWEAFGGIKLPTGSTDQLNEEQHKGVETTTENQDLELENDYSNESHDHSDSDQHALSDEESHNGHHSLNTIKHGELLEGHGRSLVGGHDLALGSGAYDWIGGAALFGQRERFYVNGFFQYTLRQKGDYDFEFGDDIQWHVGPGYFLGLEHDQSVGMRIRLSGEWKREDKEAGATVNKSDINRIFVGPELMVTGGASTFFSLGIDFLIASEAADRGVLPQQRFIGAISHRF
jgi:hypothetical protein